MSADGGTGLVVLLTTAPNPEVAERLGETLVAERLAACANLVPGVQSIFRWQGVLSRETEVLIVLKSTRDRLERLRARLVELHPYEVPEVVALDVHAGHAPYLDWVRADVGSPP